MSIRYGKVGQFIVAAVMAIGACAPSYAAKKQDAALVNAVINQMETSGALDAALDRAIVRKIQREAEMRMQQAEEAQKKRAELPNNARKVDPARDQIHGSLTARLSVIVYSDLECPYCKHFAGIPEAAAAKFGDQVNVVWRHYPLEFHGANARKEAYAAECVSRQAGREGFFKFVTTLLGETVSNGKGHPQGDAGLLALAKRSGLKDESAFNSCLADPAIAQRVDEDMKDGIGAGVEGTPGVILRVNASGRSVIVGGVVPQDTLEQAIQKRLDAKDE